MTAPILLPEPPLPEEMLAPLMEGERRAPDGGVLPRGYSQESDPSAPRTEVHTAP